MAAEKSSLVRNINRRKRAGTSRPKSRSTIAPEAYDDMQHGWPAGAKKTSKRATKKAPRKATKKPRRKMAKQPTRARA